MVRIVKLARLSNALRVLLSCTVFVMYSAMIRIYQDTEAPHDMHPGLETCRHIRDLARNKYDGEYLIRSDVVAQISLLWSQSDCSKYAGLLTGSPHQAKAQTSEQDVRGERDSQEAVQKGPAVEAANPLHSVIGAAVHHPGLVRDLPGPVAGALTSLLTPARATFSTRSDDVPSPPPRA